MHASPAAARGVSDGLVRVAAGNSTPRPPANSAVPMKRTSHTGTSATHGAIFAASAIGASPWLNPAMRKNADRISCAIQSVTWGAVLRGGVEDDIGGVGMRARSETSR